MQKHFVLGTLAVTGALIGCGQSSGKKTTAASTAAPPSTTPTTSSTTTNPPVILPTSSSSTTGAGPKIASISPANGPLVGGNSVRITGSNFRAAGAGQTLVLFGTTGVYVTPASDSELRVNVAPTSSSGVVEVRVVNDLGTAVLTSGYLYAQAATLRFSPAVGHDEPGQGGTRITISVADFAPLSANATVKFGAVASTKVAVIDSSTLTAEVPAGLTPGRVAVTVEDGGQSVAAADFLVQANLNYGDLTINEFCTNPSGADVNADGTRSSTADEFIEIVNCTKDPVDLSFLTIRDATGERHRFPNPSTLAPGAVVVVFGGGTPTDVPALTNQAGTGDLGLNNTNDTIEIRTLPGTRPSGVGDTIFRVDYTTAPVTASLTNPLEGQRITKNPATSADYVDHSKAQNAKGPYSPGRKADGSKF